MLRNCDKMIVIPPTTHECPQTHHIDGDHKVSMEKAGEKQQEALKCPRCDSSNTKFCYYNNYSLSQPRHFCKACKRYWTRGGTLRNVPVGGGYRKNKRGKKPTTSYSSSPSTPSATSNPSSQPQIDIASISSHINPLFYGLTSNPCDVNLQFSRLNSRISSSGYDLQPHQNSLGLGFSSGSGIIMSSEASGHNGYRNGFTSNNTLLSSYSNSMFSSSSTYSTSTTPVLFSSPLLQQKFINATGGGVKEGLGSNTFQGLAPLEQLQMASNGSEVGMVALKGVKVEEGQKNRLEWTGVCQSHMEPVSLSDPSLYWNTPTAMAAWNDQPNNNIGPSLTSL